MTKEGIVDKAEEYVRAVMRDDCTGHDFLHADRVRKTALQICDIENDDANREIVGLVALLHDVEDAKLDGGTVAPRHIVRECVLQWSGDGELAARVCLAVSEIGFKGGFNTPPSSPEARIVQDADRLDALGAIGIARAFAYGGHKGQKLFDPAIEPRIFASESEYRQRTGTTVNHFHEKLLRLPGMLNTATAKKMAEERLVFMDQFLYRLGVECGFDFRK